MVVIWIGKKAIIIYKLRRFILSRALIIITIFLLKDSLLVSYNRVVLLGSILVSHRVWGVGLFLGQIIIINNSYN